MLVSVVIPCYNPGAFLLEALESVALQTHPDYEIIVVNDGSGPESAAVLAQARERFPDIVWLNLPANGGVARARNIGIAHAMGELIAFLDQDDRWAADKLKVQAEYLAAHAECDYVTARQRYFLSPGVDSVPTWVKPEHMEPGLPGFLPGTLMVRRGAFDRNGLFDETLKAGTDDVDWFFRAQAAGLKSAELPQTLLHKRIHGGNLSQQARAHNQELLAVVRANLRRRQESKEAKISVVIPCYNAKAYIAQALESAAGQGELIGEIIVVDDASRDGSAEYVESLGLPCVVLHRLARNMGISGARNAGVALARFPLLAFLDADDLWPAQRCAQLLRAMERADTPWAFGAIEHFGDAGKYALPPVQTGYFASAMLARTEFFRRVGPFNEQLRVGEFIDWFDRARRHATPPAVIEPVVLRRRIHGENSSIVAGNRHVGDYLKVARAAIARRKQQADAVE